MINLGQRLDRAFFARASEVVAPDLLGCLLVAPGEGLTAGIVEVEAYDQADPASHSHRGPTPSNQVMFGPAGHLYTYFTYGMHWCANVVTGPTGHGQAVLLRAAEPVTGHETFHRRRRGASPRDLLRGPARLAQAFGLDGGVNGLDLVADDAPLRLHAKDEADTAPEVVTGPRVGVRLAADVPRRYSIAGSRLVSTYKRHAKAL
ncbi:DNA-3-methyladenine glycosylase [soil metagenome]